MKPSPKNPTRGLLRVVRSHGEDAFEALRVHDRLIILGVFSPQIEQGSRRKGKRRRRKS